MIITIDRFENNFAIVELTDKSFVDMPLSLIPKGAVEGDCISITIDDDETKKRKTRIDNLAKSLWK